jgi:hypothetical protein
MTRSYTRLPAYKLLQSGLLGFMNNIFSGKKCRASPEGVSLMDETNNLASHPRRSPLIHSYGYESAGDHPTCLASLPLKSRSFIQYAEPA